MKRIATTKADETPEFIAFWTAWRPQARHTDGRGEARDTFFQHVKAGVDPQDIVDGAKCFLRTMKERDREYIPLASSWLNKRAYEDLAEKERAFQAKLEESRQSSANVVQMPERRVKTKFMRDWEALHGKDYFEHYDEAKRRAGE